MAVLRNDPLAPDDLRKKALMMAGLMLEMTGKYKKGQGLLVARELLEKGKALQKMKQIIKAQGRQKKSQLGQFCYHVCVRKIGRIQEIDNLVIAKIARVAGAPEDKGAGLYLRKKVHEMVRRGDPLYTVYAKSQFKLGLAKDLIRQNNGYIVK